MTLRPAGLNKAIACLFIVGSALFLLGSVPAYVNAVGATAGSITYFIGSIFFTAASFSQLLQAQTPAMTGRWLAASAGGGSRGLCAAAGAVSAG